MLRPPQTHSQGRPDSVSGLRATPWFVLAVALHLFGCRSQEAADEDLKVRVAVATNFASTAADLARAFERETGTRVEVSTGSSGKIFAQIAEGAPYDLFLSADAERPTRLLNTGHGITGSLFTYAEGRLALLCSERRRSDCRKISGSPDQSRALVEWLSASEGKLSLADPALAPYGLAAKQVLTTKSRWKDLKWQFIVAESVGQAFHFVATENVDAGFVALSQLQGTSASFVPVPDELHTPIQQKALLLKEKPPARAFWNFLRQSPIALRLIDKAGYRRATNEPPKDP